jgi:hypothetical protein
VTTGKKVIIFLIINRLFFLIETRRILCEMGTASVCTMGIHFCFLNAKHVPCEMEEGIKNENVESGKFF